MEFNFCALLMRRTGHQPNELAILYQGQTASLCEPDEKTILGLTPQEASRRGIG
jgi:hypothetical protein